MAVLIRYHGNTSRLPKKKTAIWKFSWIFTGILCEKIPQQQKLKEMRLRNCCLSLEQATQSLKRTCRSQPVYIKRSKRDTLACPKEYWKKTAAKEMGFIIKTLRLNR